jgi:nitronate monooxygenase
MVTTSKNAIVNAGLDPDTLPVADITAMSFASDSGAKVWRDIRGAAQGRGIMHDVPTVAGVVARLKKDIAARSRIAATHFLR